MRRLLIVLGFLLGIALTGEPLTAAAQTGGKTIRMEIKSEKLTTSLKRLERVSGYKILFSYDDLSRFTVSGKTVNTKSIRQALDILLAGTPLKYEVDGQFVNVYLSETVTRTAQLSPASDGTKLKGRVFDVHGEPVVGAVVRDSKHKLHTTTDLDGLFTLAAPDERVSLSVTFLGMKPATWTGRRGTFASIVIEDADNALDDVVITGYQVINKRALTSAVTTVKAEDIIRPDALSIDQMLEGRIPDMMFMSNSGEAGVAPKIRIRGTSSIIGNREPLWVVDGIVVTDPVQISPEELNDPDYVNRIGNAIAGINPQDIERLDVLKDAAATALYGTKAANGVIVITTKRGREGKPQIQYSNSFTYKRRPRYSDRSVDVMDSKERIQFSRELFADHYEYGNNISPVGYEGLLMNLYAGKITDQEFKEQVAFLETNNTDWFKLLTKDSFSQQHTLSLNGGSERGTYYASIGYNDTDDVVKGNKNKRYTATLNLDTKFTKWLSASFSMNGNISQRDYYQSSLAPVNYAYTASRAIRAYEPDGHYSYYDKMVSNTEGYHFNILNELANSGVEQEGASFNFNANFRLKFTNWLTGNLIGSYSSQTTDINDYWGDKTCYVAQLRRSNYGDAIRYPEDSVLPQGGQYGTSRTRSNSYTLRFQLDGDTFLDKDEIHRLSANIGAEMSSTRYKGYQRTDRGYYPDRGMSFVEDINITKYPAYATWLAGNTPSLTDNLSNTLSGYLSLTYSYDSKLYVNANARVDGSNNFGDRSNEKLLPIWSVSASYDLSKLPWVEKASWIDYFSVKASYGFQGNMLSSVYPVMIIKKNPISDYYDEFTASATSNPNPNLKWERTDSYNIGLDFGLFDRRVELSASLYFKRTKDAFMTKTISTVNGYQSYTVNGGNISNDGYSVDITVHPIKTKDWRWTLTTSFSHTTNKITTSPAGEEYNLENFLNGSAVVKGKPVGTFYSYRFVGLSPLDGGPLFDTWEEHWEDLVGLSKYDTYTNVLVASGSREPDMSGGLSTSLRWKQLRFNASFAYSIGAKTRLFGMYSSGASGNGKIMDAGDIRPENNMSRDYIDRWMKPGDEKFTNIPAIITPAMEGHYRYSNHWSNSADGKGVQPIAESYWDMYDYSDIRVASADYLKCQSLSLTYEFPKQWLQGWGVSLLELTASGHNLFTIADSRLKGQTPTQGGFTTIELSDRPSFSFGLRVNF